MATVNAVIKSNISEIIDQNISIVLQRFNCCTCHLCKEYISRNVLNSIDSEGLFAGNSNSENFKKEIRAFAIRNLLKNTINLKNNPIH